MKLSEIGQYANNCWLEIPNHFAYFYLDKFVIMLNHLHGIIVIDKPLIDDDVRNVVETGHALSLPQQKNSDDQSSKPPHFRFRNQGKNTISAAVGSFKSAVTKYCRENRFPFGWQVRFYDNILRNSDEMYSARNYIIHNPRNWSDDRFY